MFVILVPVCLGPVIGILLWSQNKAKKLELLRPVEEFTAKKPLQTIKNFLSEMDVSKDSACSDFPCSNMCPFQRSEASS